jgi:hypothetical protein
VLYTSSHGGGQAEDLMKMAAGEKGGGDDGRAGRPRRANHGEELLAKLRTKGVQSINFFFV